MLTCAALVQLLRQVETEEGGSVKLAATLPSASACKAFEAEAEEDAFDRLATESLSKLNCQGRPQLSMQVADGNVYDRCLSPTRSDSEASDSGGADAAQADVPAALDPGSLPAPQPLAAPPGGRRRSALAAAGQHRRKSNKRVRFHEDAQVFSYEVDPAESMLDDEDMVPMRIRKLSDDAVDDTDSSGSSSDEDSSGGGQRTSRMHEEAAGAATRRGGPCNLLSNLALPVPAAAGLERTPEQTDDMRSAAAQHKDEVQLLRIRADHGARKACAAVPESADTRAQELSAGARPQHPAAEQTDAASQPGGSGSAATGADVRGRDLFAEPVAGSEGTAGGNLGSKQVCLALL